MNNIVRYSRIQACHHPYSGFQTSHPYTALSIQACCIYIGKGMKTSTGCSIIQYRHHLKTTADVRPFQLKPNQSPVSCRQPQTAIAIFHDVHNHQPTMCLRLRPFSGSGQPGFWPKRLVKQTDAPFSGCCP